MLKDMVEASRVVRRLEVITGAGGRRRWSAAEKARILQEALAPGAVVSQVARRHGLSPQHLFTWRRLARRMMAAEPQTPPVTFVPAVIAPAASEPAPPPPARPRRSRRRGPCAGIELEIAGVVVRIGADASEAAIAAVIRALKASP
jgi:transposase